jgi:hypothetical protein
MVKLTPEQMADNFRIIEAEYDERTIDDAEFANAAAIIGEWLANNFMKCGYKRMARLLVSEYKASVKMNKAAK